jgi:hypothetical protein
VLAEEALDAQSLVAAVDAAWREASAMHEKQARFRTLDSTRLIVRALESAAEQSA